MLAAQATMVPSHDDSDVLVPEVTSTAPGAYPLTVLTYAATAPAAIDVAAGAAYAALLRYAVGAGQALGVHPGDLPEGYAPLPGRLRNQTLTAATTIETMAGRPVADNPSLTVAAQPGAPAEPDSCGWGRASGWRVGQLRRRPFAARDERRDAARADGAGHGRRHRSRTPRRRLRRRWAPRVTRWRWRSLSAVPLHWRDRPSSDAPPRGGEAATGRFSWSALTSHVSPDSSVTFVPDHFVSRQGR